MLWSPCYWKCDNLVFWNYNSYPFHKLCILSVRSCSLPHSLFYSYCSVFLPFSLGWQPYIFCLWWKDLTTELELTHHELWSFPHYKKIQNILVDLNSTVLMHALSFSEQHAVKKVQQLLPKFWKFLFSEWIFYRDFA